MQEAKKENIIAMWFSWHFYEAPKFLIGVWQNYIFFVSNYFSLPLLLATFFSPWRRYAWRYPRGFDIGEYYKVFISNIFSRIIGAMMRFVFIVLGIMAQIFTIITGLIIILFWVLIPLIIIGLMLFFFYV